MIFDIFGYCPHFNARFIVYINFVNGFQECRIYV